jgi:Tfp pilus tip-associated adhesin PilY1
MTTSNPSFSFRLRVGLVAVLLGLAVAAQMQADDRDLVRASGQEPYLFIVFDVSGSMTWQPPDEANGVPTDAFAPAFGDDPRSKFYQAKSALFKTLQDRELQDILWGFAPYNHDESRVFRKHWVYTPTEDPSWASTVPYPLIGQPKLFGDPCFDNQDDNTTCNIADANNDPPFDPPQADFDFDFAATPPTATLGACDNLQDLSLHEGLGEVLNFPALGDDPTSSLVQTSEWVRVGTRDFAVVYTGLASGVYGDDTIDVGISIRESGGCDNWISDWESDTITFGKTFDQDNSVPPRQLTGGNQTLIWQADAQRDGDDLSIGWFNNADDSRTTNQCSGWEPNTDSAQDISAGVNLHYTTVDDPLNRHATAFDRGDLIPWDWQDEAVWGIGNSNRIEIMKHLAPSFDGVDPGTADFRVATYFEDHPDTLFPTNGSGHLPLKTQFVNRPPMIPNGLTPIGNSMNDFKNWFDAWKAVASGPGGDPFFGCRSVNLLILTDGDENCYGGSTGGTTDGQGDHNPCAVATELLDQGNRNVRTFVIGFGVPGTSANFLNCIAQNGGTDEIDLDNDGIIDVTGPILPGSEDDLVTALKSIATAVQAQSRSFASAAVPQAQVNVDDKVYLTSFQPIENTSVWPGRLDAYLRPVPLRTQDFTLPDGSFETRLVPDPTQACGPNDESQCHVWNAAEELMQQAPTDAEVMAGTFNLGTAENQRRIHYSLDRTDYEIPVTRRDFVAPTSDALWMDIMVAMGICEPGDAICRDDPDQRDRVNQTLEFFHGIKIAPDPNDPNITIEYLLGDFFHSDPLVKGNPDNFRFWVADVEGDGSLPLEKPCDTSPDGYRCFFEKHRLRRKVIFGGTNDGQFHGFDAGIFRGTCEQGQLPGTEFVVGEFDNGTGRELFSYVPRIAMPLVRGLAETPGHTFTVDGRIVVGDIFIDPEQPTGTPTAADRQWRSALVSGLREGGSGYFSLDITQPDELLECNGTPSLPQPLGGTAGWVPSCSVSNANCDFWYPQPLWEFIDDMDCVNEFLDGPYIGRCDDDGNGRRDLADSWSTPTIGRIRVIPQGNTEPIDKYVAIFGGGMDAERNGQSDAGGNFIYMVDMETGRAIYKRQVIGSAMADMAAVDTNQDGYLDTIYIGTTAGLLYKADIGIPQELEDRTSLDQGFKVTSALWAPFPIFSTEGKSISPEVTVIFVPELGQFALAVGTGDREDLWAKTLQEGRFYLFLDRAFELGDANLPLTEADLQRIDTFDSNASGDLLRQPPFGWYFPLEVEERVISRAFSLAGVTVFSSFQPDEDVSGDGSVCRRFGNSRSFVVNTTNGNSLLPSGDRFFVIEGGFLSPAFAETSQTKNPGSGSGGPTASDLPDNLSDVIEEIKKLLPNDCRFANYTINIKAVRDDTGIQFLAAIPVCTQETNWKDL